jgi:tetratricopeptide (TPR) repeat protein
VRLAALVLVLLSVSPPAGRGAGSGPSGDAPPAAQLSAPGAEVPERRIEALPPGGTRRAELFLDLALRRHAAADAAEAEERAAGAAATPRADALLAEAARLAERALEEGEGAGPGGFRGEPEALLVLGLDLRRVGRGREALRALARLVRRFPESPLAPDAWLALGEHHLAEGDLTRARAAFEVAARAGAPPVRGWSEARLAEVALRIGDVEGALAAAARALDAGSARALALLDGLTARPEKLEPAARGRVAEMGERSGAPPSLAPAAAAAGVAPAPSRQRRGPGERADSDPLALRPSGAAPWPPGERAPADVRLGAWNGDAAALHALGLARLVAGDAAGTRALLERAGAAAPADAAIANDLGAARAAAGDLPGARAALETAAAAADPPLPGAHENLAAVALAQGDAARAEDTASRAVLLEPGRWEPRLLRARALAALGRVHEALAEAERVIDLAAGKGDALALVEALRGRLACGPDARTGASCDSP